jgi:hypothetical protein
MDSERTPDSAYEVPILRALVELGGRADMREVLPMVERQMRHVLTPFDYQLSAVVRSWLCPNFRAGTRANTSADSRSSARRSDESVFTSKNLPTLSLVLYNAKSHPLPNNARWIRGS